MAVRLSAGSRRPPGVHGGSRIVAARQPGGAENENLLLAEWIIWGRYYVTGKEAGLADEEIGRITEGPEASRWNDFDATLLRAADKLHTSRFEAHFACGECNTLH